MALTMFQAGNALYTHKPISTLVGRYYHFTSDETEVVSG